MKFETIFRNSEKRKKEGEEEKEPEPGSLAGYDKFNREPIKEILEKRRREEEEIRKRQEEKAKKLRELKEKGTIYIKE